MKEHIQAKDLNGLVSEAKKMAEEGFSITNDTCEVVIKGFLEFAEFDAALSLLNVMHAQSVIPTKDTWAALTTAAKSPEQVQDLENYKKNLYW